MAESDKPILGFIEWCGTHPFATGLMAIVGILGTIFSIYAFQVDREENKQSTMQSERMEGSIDNFADESTVRETEIQESLGRIEKAAPKSILDRIPNITNVAYSDAKTRLIESGWIPDKKPWRLYLNANSTVQDIWEQGLEEVDDCLQTGNGACRFLYYNPEGVNLVVVAIDQGDGLVVQRYWIEEEE
ncbi:hypothetical protein [Parasphingorhabdus sp.]|uniref:hypothetical protein n=1 Tax=Parasphingorhabdus sp. TaxID=2709688 RepID=UPI003A958204